MGEAGRAGDIDAAVNRINPSGAQFGTTMPVVPRIKNPARIRGASSSFSRRWRLAAGNADLDADIARCTMKLHHLGNSSAHHFRGTGLIAGSPGRTPALVTVPTPGPAADPGAPRQTVGRRQHAVRDVGIVSGILDDTGASPIRSKFGNGQGKCDALTVRQRNLDRMAAESRQSPALRTQRGWRRSHKRQSSNRAVGGRAFPFR